MGVTAVAARVSELAARQWGLLTTSQAEAEGVTRLQLARLADSRVIERLDRGIYAVPAAIDERTPLRVAWLSLDSSTLAEERLADPVSSGVLSHTAAASLHRLGDLLDDVPEITLPERKQSRRGIRFHRGALDRGDVTIVDGLPVTTAARTVADLLRDGHDPSHVAEIAGDALRRDLTSRLEMAATLEPLARRNGQTDGAALLEHLLHLVDLSSEALVAQIAASDLGRALVAAGQLNAIENMMEMVAELRAPNSGIAGMDTSALATFAREVVIPRFSDGVLPVIDTSAIIDAAKFPVPLDGAAFREALATSVSTWLPGVIRGLPKDVQPSSKVAMTPADRDKSSR